MAVEARRGCGYRKIGGLYLCGSGAGHACDRMPIPLHVCPVCSHGFKQARGWTWIDVNGLVGGVHRNCADEFACPLCMATSEMGKAGMLWIGEKFYKTPGDFVREGDELGMSRRISAVPRGFKLGETWVLLAHPKTMVCDECVGTGINAGVKCDKCDSSGRLPGIFRIWQPRRIEKILPESLRGSEEVHHLMESGITPVFVPDDDRDHQGSVYDHEVDIQQAVA